MSYVVEVKNVTKYYTRRLGPFSKETICAVEDLTLAVEPGDIFALLGPNGAGKTTTLNIIAGLLPPSSGEVNIFGHRLDNQDRDFYQRIGFLSEENYLPDYISLIELLQFLTRIFNFSLKFSRQRIDWVVEHLKLKDLLKKRIRDLSSGQKRIAGLSCALLNDPDLLILDEPTVYLDPLVVKDLVEIINNFKIQTKTVIISSHILSQVEKLCNRLAILKAGRIKFYGPSRSLSEKGTLEDVFIGLVS
ncbi:MAG: ABC transporter ATP-binding protein [Candidatus Omnitrophota bacterium]